MNEVKINGIYRHFKGDLYLVEDIIYHSETEEKMVAYRALYGDNKLWCRPYDMFLYNSGWGCAAYCEIRNDLRHFELKRINKIELLYEKF